MFSVGDRVVILVNDFDEPFDNEWERFEGETGVVRDVKDVQSPLGEPIKIFEVELDNKKKHALLSEGFDNETWPFHYHELAYDRS